MSEITGNFFLADGFFEPIEKFEKVSRKMIFEVYEVIRVISGVPLFCEDHFCRMMNSLQLLHKNIPVDFQDFEEQMKLLSSKNNFQNGNIKIVVGEQTKNLLMYFIPHHYPAEAEYRQGVKTDFYHAERVNPNVKAHLAELRKNVNDYLKESGYFEVFYVDRNGAITEGSRSNVFFIREGIVYTCPPEKVLLGVTRQKVIECLKNTNIPLIETAVTEAEAASFESVFLTGTSPKILPVSAIDELKFSCASETMQKIRNEYDRMIEQYVQLKLAAR